MTYGLGDTFCIAKRAGYAYGLFFDQDDKNIRLYMENGTLLGIFEGDLKGNQVSLEMIPDIAGSGMEASQRKTFKELASLHKKIKDSVEGMRTCSRVAINNADRIIDGVVKKYLEE